MFETSYVENEERELDICMHLWHSVHSNHRIKAKNLLMICQFMDLILVTFKIFVEILQVD